MLRPLTASLRDGRDLAPDEIAGACDQLLDERVPFEDRADFLRALHTKGETPAEVAEFVRVLLARAVRPDLGRGLLDVCGTGGDRSGLFNVSTATMFVVAACGVRLVKHGNRGITSKCGGADVLESLGVRLDADPAAALKAAGCCFLFAPRFHPSFQAIAPVRKALAAEGTATVFNMLGPLLNPAAPDFQLAGVFHDRLLPIYAETFRLLGRTRAWVVHGHGGLDEVSTLGDTTVVETTDAGTRRFAIDPRNLGTPRATRDDLLGGTAAQNAALILDLLEGRETGPRRDIVLLNSACALVVSGAAADIAAGLGPARDALASGAARDVLRRLAATA